MRHFKIAWRYLLKDRLFTLLNMTGLSTGLACALLIYLWVDNELSMDRFHENSSRLYQVMRNTTQGDIIETRETNSDLLAPALLQEMPEIESIVPVTFEVPDGVLSASNKDIRVTGRFAGKDFFKVFTYTLSQGNKDKALQGKDAIVISEALAASLFGEKKNALNKTVTWDRQPFAGTYVITGVFKQPANSSLPFDFLLTNDRFLEKRTMNIHWDSNSVGVYLTLKKGADAARFNEKIKDFVRNKYKAAYGPENLQWAGTLFIQRYSDRYLHGQYENGAPAGGRIRYIELFSVIAVFILMIACINFMNLSTARASRRFKEVGVKKVAGAGRGSLILQYLSESVLMAYLSLAVAVLLTILLLPLFNTITGKQLTFQLNASLCIAALSITFLTGILAGSYPAFYLSGFKPVTALKGRFSVALGELWVRKGLVVFQFTVSIIFIVAVLIIYRQMQLVQSINLGYNKGNVLSFKKEGRLNTNLQTFLAEIRRIPGVENAASFHNDMIGDHGGTGGLAWEGKSPNASVEFGSLSAGYELIEMLGIEIAEGRAFSRKFGADSAAIIFNQAAIDAMGLKNPIGKKVQLWGNEREIVGVVKNFHFESLYEKVKPCFLLCNPEGKNILVRIRKGMENETLGRIGKFYAAYNPGLAFEYTFLDEDYQALYASEQRVAVLSRYFAALAILISCLGLFGLVAFTAQRRQKEIGIRKVLGATVSNIVVMLSKDFLKLVLIAALIAFPLAWWIMDHWLRNFAYHINMESSVFLLSGAAIMLIALLTISLQAIKTAVANPVNNLRTE
jgi:putative ABC transport system permease protein